MPDRDALEKELKDHYKREYLLKGEVDGEDRIYQLVIDHLYGKGIRDSEIQVDWKKVFEENQCPQCKDTLSLKQEGYICPKCGLTIPLDLYDRASKGYRQMAEVFAEDKRLIAQAKSAGIDSARRRRLYDEAVQEAVNGLRAEEARKKAELQKKAESSKAAGSLKMASKRRGTDEKR